MSLEDMIQASGTAKPAPNKKQVISFPRATKQLLPDSIAKEVSDRSFLSAVLKAEQGSIPSGQGITAEEKLQPFNFSLASSFKNVNVHHSSCISVKVSSTVGLGFESPNDLARKEAKRTGQPAPAMPASGEVARIDEILNPLTVHSWQNTLQDVCEDYWEVGNGYLEVVRDESGTVCGLHHIPAKEVTVVLEDRQYNFHYIIKSSDEGAITERRFARFGDLESFQRRLANPQDIVRTARPVTVEDIQTASEVIHFSQPSSKSRWYGFPDWLAATSSIELDQCMTQQSFDFFLNRGVPEFMLFILGQQLDKDDRERIEKAMQATIGLGNQHKSLMINLPKDDVKVQLEKLALDSTGDGSQFAANSEALSLKIVSAHRVPPLLAGIQIPGKLGASNEMVQAMQAFQALVIAPAQRLFTQVLARTLGSDPSLGLQAADLVFNTVTDAIDVDRMDTIARMRQSPQEAEAEGRDIDDGLRD